jgi:hypothetical protein
VTVKAKVTGRKKIMSRELLTSYPKYKRLFKEKLDNVVEPEMEIEVAYKKDTLTGVAREDRINFMEIGGKNMPYARSMTIHDRVPVEKVMEMVGLPHLGEEAKKQAGSARKFRIVFTTAIKSMEKEE